MLAATIVAFTVLAYGSALRVPFIGDDYVFLDKTRHASFGSLWSFANTDFGWYRPWSRELHFWALQHLFGPHELGFRAVSLLLWLSALAVFFVFARRIAGVRIAAVALLGATSLSLWGAPLTWISGTQDLWMLLFSCVALWLVDRDAGMFALPVYAAALLSKETAAMLPLVVFAHARWIRERTWGDAARAAMPFLAVTAGWFALHPALAHRLTHPVVPGPDVESPVPPLRVATNSLLSLLNLDKLALPFDPQAFRPLATVLSAPLLPTAALWTLRGSRPAAPGGTDRVPRGRIALFGAAWCVAGWLPLFQPSVGWHAYYGSLGALGGWLALAAWIEPRPRFAAAVLLSLGLLRGYSAAVRTWDWGSEWYQTRAGNMLSVIRSQLLALHPTLPHHTRLYFGNIPNNVGLIAGRSPAVRVWYDDSTLTAGFYSYYRPRPTPTGPPDLFFHFDSTAGIREVFADGRPDPQAGRSSDWVGDRERLAVTFIRTGDFAGAARLYESIARVHERPDAAMFAGVCREAAGDSLRAAADFADARVRTRASSAEITAWAERLRRSVPR